jgi:hypothetical protein
VSIRRVSDGRSLQVYPWFLLLLLWDLAGSTAWSITPTSTRNPSPFSTILTFSYDIVPEYIFPKPLDGPLGFFWICGAVVQGVCKANEVGGDTGARIVVVNGYGEMSWWSCRKGDISIGIGELIL